MTGKRRVKKISTIAVAGAMSVNALMPYSILQVEAAENTQDNSFTGGTANKLLQDQLAKALKNSNKTADQVVQATYGSFSTLSSASNVTTGTGKYKVTGVQTMTDWKVTGNVVVYLPKGSILYVVASPVNKEQAGRNALTIASGAHLTVVGEGYLAIRGGTGGAGYDRVGQATGSGVAVTGQTGGTGKVGGYAISNSGTFEVSTLFTGSASILGGSGGDGGKGQDVAPNNVLSTAGFTGGTGGVAGNGATAINNNGNIIINGDSVNKNLSTTGAYGQGNVNIKGGLGGRGGEGGTAHGATVTWTREGTEKQAEYPGDLLKGWGSGIREDKPNKEDGYKLYWHGPSSESKDVATLYPATAGAAGATGAAGVGIAGGTITMNGGFTSVEGGNGNVSYAAGNNNGAPGYIAGTSLEGKSATWGTQTINDYSKNPAFDDTQPESDTNVKFIYTGDTQKDNKVSEKRSFPVACVFGNKTTYSSGNVALYGVNVVRNGGTLQAYAGTSSSVAISGGTQTGFGGTFFAGASSSDGYSGNQASSSATFQLAQLEGTGTAADGTQINVTDAKNFYILNAGDTYYDANGKLQTALGIKVNGKPYGGKDIFVNPQGYVYLSGVKTSDTVVMQVAIGGKRIGDAGSASKYVTSDAGIYTFTGSNGKLKATFASDTTSMDMEWLAKQMANDFSGNQVEIDTPYKLAAFAYAVNHGVDGAANAHIKLTSNIDLKAMYWTPIGTKSHPFIGVFDGNGKTIKNMRIQTISSVDAYGLFGYVKGTQDGKNITSVITNFTLTNGEYVTNASAKTIKVNSADGGTTSGGGYKDIATYQVVATSGDVYAGAVAGHAENTAFSKINVENLPMTVNSATGDVHFLNFSGFV